jgi:two-component system chemotaxis sensor kinase CheA
VALFADELLGQQETVIKGLTGWMKHARCVSGCTILGDGEVGLILDVPDIASRMRPPLFMPREGA